MGGDRLSIVASGTPDPRLVEVLALVLLFDRDVFWTCDLLHTGTVPSFMESVELYIRVLLSVF